MAGEWPPLRASPRPLAVVLGLPDGRLRAGNVGSRLFFREPVPDSPFQRAVLSDVVKNERSFRCDPIAKTNAGGPPDSQLRPHYRRRLHSQRR